MKPLEVHTTPWGKCEEARRGQPGRSRTGIRDVPITTNGLPDGRGPPHTMPCRPRAPPRPCQAPWGAFLQRVWGLQPRRCSARPSRPPQRRTLASTAVSPRNTPQLQDPRLQTCSPEPPALQGLTLARDDPPCDQGAALSPSVPGSSPRRSTVRTPTARSRGGSCAQVPSASH